MGEGGRERLHIYRYTVTTRMTPELRWAAMRAIVMFHNCEGQSQDIIYIFIADKKIPSRCTLCVPLLTSLTPYRGAKPAHFKLCQCVYTLSHHGVGTRSGEGGG